MNSKLVIRGRVWKFGDNVNTDVITPGKYLSLPISKIKDHIMEPLDPSFPKKVEKGDIIVAGRNFGCGSSREQAPRALKEAGISLIIAESFARIFFRNSISIGLPVLQCKGISEFCNEGDVLEVNLKTAEIKNLRSGKVLSANPLSGQILKILEAGGIISMLREMVREGSLD